MASLNSRDGIWTIGFSETCYSVSILTTLISITQARTYSTLSEKKWIDSLLISINDSVISLSHIRTEIWNTHNSGSEFSFQISNETGQRMKMMKKAIIFFQSALFQTLCCNYRNPVGLSASFSKNFYM